MTEAAITGETMGAIEPTAGQLERLAGADDGRPVVMINLLRFKAVADGIDAGEEISGAEAYGRYAAAVTTFLQQVGARVQLAVAAQQSVIGPEASEWDMLLAVEYPSRAAFLEMVSDPDYLAVHGHRAGALADSRLIACAPVGP